jgi:ATP-binding protein involved in chromosome partitioning
MTPNLQERVTDALSRIRNNRLGANVLEAEMIRDIATTTDGKVRLSLFLTPDDDATVVREVRQTLQQVPGVTDVRVDVKDASQANKPLARAVGSTSRATAPPAPSAPTPAPKSGASRTLPVMGQEPQSQRAAVPAPTPVAYPHLGNIIAISSGKGGVGKSTVASNLAIALAKQGARVGLMDADIYGPNIPRMMGINAPPPVENEKIIPLQAHGVKIMSLGFMIERDQPAIWRGPIIMKIITQFLRDVQWGELDYFLVDMPPGTGDAQLSLVQATMVHGAIIVTTPQEVASGDALRGAKMFERVAVPVLGIVENMSYFICPNCEAKHTIFGSGGGKRLADELNVPLLGEIPFFPGVLSGGDRGEPIVVSEPETPAAQALFELAGRLKGLL